MTVRRHVATLCVVVVAAPAGAAPASAGAGAPAHLSASQRSMLHGIAADT
jgi:hypothetical protein